MQNNDNTRKLYDALVADNYELGDYEKFASDISNPEYMRKLYDTMVADDYELGEYNTFSSRYSVTPQGKAAQATQATARTAQPVVDAYGMPMQPEVSTIEDAPKVEEKPQENLKSDLFKPQSTETPSLLNVGAKPKDYFAEAGAKAMEGIRQERQAREYQEIMKPLSGIEGSEQKKILEERKKQIEAQLNQPDAVRNAAARTNMAKALENVDKELQVLNEQQKQWQEQYGSWTPSSARRFREHTMEQTWYDPYAVVPEEYKALATQKWGKEGSEDAYFSAWMNLSPEEREAFVKREHIKSFFNEETANRMQDIRERATTYAQNALSEPVVSVDPRHSASAMAARTVNNIGVQTTKALDKAEEIKQAYKNHELDENFFAGAYKGMKDGLTDIDNWTGLYMVGEMTNLYDIADKMARGDALTQTEEDFLDAQAYKLAVEAALADDLGWGYSSGNVTGASVPFMLQMLASPIGGASGKAIDKGFAAVGRRAIDKFGKGILKKLLTKAPVKKIAKGLVGTVGKGIGQTILFGSDRVAAGTMERHLGNEMVAERANEEFNAGVQAKAGEDLGTALFKAGVSASMENISEFAGGAFIDDFTKMVGKKISKEFMDAMGGSVGKRMAKAAARQNANKVFRAIANNKWGQHAVKLSKSVQSGMEWDGLLNEFLEEVLNNASNVMIGDMSMEDFTSLEKNAETLLGLAWTSGFFMANNAASRVGGYVRGNIALKRTDRAARQIFTGDMQEKWDAYTQALSQADGYEEVEQLYKGLMTDISKNQDKEAAKAQMSEATAYMANYVKMMGMNAATEEADEEEQKTPAQKDVETAQGEGIAAQGTEKELDVVEEMDESYNQLAGHLEGTNVEDWLLQYGETAAKQLEAIRGSELDEQTKAVAEAYLTSAQRYEGLLLANQEEVDAIVEEAAKEFDANVNQELGSVIQVLTTQGKTAYVIQGNPNEREDIRLRYEDGTTEPVSHVVVEKVLSQADAQTMRSDMIEGVRKSAVAEVVKRMQGVVPNATQMQMPVGHNVVVDGQAGVVAGVNADGTMQIQMHGGNVVNAAPQQVMDAQAYNTIMERKARARESARVSVPVREEVAAPVAEETTAAETVAEEAVAEEAVAEEEELTEAQKLLQEYMDESISLEDRQAIVGNNAAQAKQAAMEAQAEVDAMTESKPKATDYTSIAEFKQAQEQWKAQMQEKQQALDLARQQEATWNEVQKGMVQPVETAAEQASAEAVPTAAQVTEVQRAEAKTHNSKHDIKALAKEIGVSAKRIQRVIDFANQVGVKLNFANVTRTQGGKGAFTNADNIAKERTITLSKYQLAKGMAIEWVMGHELTHQIKADGNAANWEAYKQAIINALGQDAFDKRVKEQSKVYREAGAYRDMSANEFVETMQEEVCADAAGDMLLNPDNMNKVMGIPQSLASRIWNGLKNMVTFNTPTKIKQAVDAWQLLAKGKELTGEADGRERHSIVGTTGARALDKAEGTTVRMDNKDVAEEMEAAGKDAETIWMATGWERGADGKWRYDANDYIPEFVDNTAKKQVYEDLIDAKIKEYEAATNPAERHELRMKIDEYMDKSAELSQYFVADILGEDHPLIKAYPDLGNITIEFNPNTENCAYYPQIGLIELGTKNEDAKQNARNLAHELQHAIQHTEGFATGASTSNLNERLRKKFDAITAQIEQLRAEGRNEEADALIKQNKGLAEAVINNEGDVFGNYMKVAGEVEARNASARQDMTPEERRQTSPSKSEDVAREEQIVLEDESGKNEMGSRVDKRMDEIAQYFNGRTLSPVQQAIVDVFGGTGNNLPISISRADGSTRRVVMRQGHENKGGTKHSTLRHFDTSSGSFTPEEILLIEDILANGTITEELRRGVAVNVYQHEINGVRYTVVTEKKDRREEFADFYTNRSGGTRSSNTHLSARAGHTTASSARKGTTSSSNTQGKGNNSTQKFSITGVNEEVASLPKNEGEQALFSISTYEQQGREILEAYAMDQVSKGRLTQEQADDIISEMEDIYNICVGLKDKYAPFGNWSEAEVVVDEQGKPVFSVIKANGDYAMNLDFSLVCKKRRTLDAVLREMIDRGIINNYELGQVDMAKINDIIRQHGFETACRLCFVDAKRFRVAQVADVFCEMYNALVDKSDAQLKKISKKEGKSVPGKIARMLLEHPENRVKLSRENFMDSKGFEDMTVNKEAIMKLYNAKKGTGGPKASYGDTQYLNDILGKQWSAEAAYEVGGVRLQSFSDYVPRMVFDYIQMVADLSAKGLPVHAYTKEPTFAKQFGLTGIKINLSLVPRVEADGIAPGLDANGEYVWQEGETFPYEEAIAIQNAEGYRENCGTIAVGVSDAHIEKMLSDDNIRMVIPYHKSGLNPLVAKHNNIDQFQDYTNEQNTRDANGNKLTKAQMKSHFNFNADLHKHGNPRLAAQHYLEWCDKKGYIPKFEKFREHPNYYKLLEDFTTCVTENGVDTFVPQGAVTMTFPNEESAFGSIAELIEEGLEEDAVLEGRRQADLGSIVDDIESEFADGKKFSISAGHKQKQLDIIQESNPVGDDYHTWIRTVDDIKSFEEALDEPDYADFKGEDLDPSYTWDMVEEALQSGLITVYSSKPIENGNFVTPSRMEAESYAGNGKVYKATLPLQDIAWIDPTQGQVAKVDETKFSISAEEQLQELRSERDAFKKAMREKYNSAIWWHQKDNTSEEFLADVARRKEYSERIKQLESQLEPSEEVQQDPAREEAQQEYKRRMEMFAKAKEEYGTTEDFGLAGYMLPDGDLLDFSEGSGARSADHRSIEGMYPDVEHDSRWEYVVDFMNDGAIRIVPESGIIEMTQQPTLEQRKKLKEYVRQENGYVIVEINDANGNSQAYKEYDEGTAPNKVLADIDRYFDEGIRFSLSAEEQDIVDAAKADGTYMKAPNGEPTNLNEKQWAQVRTKAFKEWFGDWENDPKNASKVVDENGEPMVVYHGSPRKGITSFIQNYAKGWGVGSYFTDNKEQAEKEFGNNIYEVFLNLKNPYTSATRITDEEMLSTQAGRRFAEQQAKDSGWDSLEEALEEGESPYFTEEFDENGSFANAVIRQLGYDGIAYDRSNNIEGIEFVAFSPTQIKSATDNVGTFDTENADIRYSITAEQIQEMTGGKLNSSNYGKVSNAINPIGRFLYSRRESEYAPYRTVIPVPTLDDYHIATETTFTAMEGGAKEWEKMKESGKYELQQSPKSGSEYLIDRETGDIFRFSDHWGTVASCRWELEGGKSEGTYEIGKSNIQDFDAHLPSYSGGYVAKNPKFEQFVDEYRNILDVTTQNYRTLLDSGIEIGKAEKKKIDAAIAQQDWLKKSLEKSNWMPRYNEIKFSLPARPATPKRNEGESIMEYAQRVANATEAQKAWDVANKTAMDIDRQIKNSEEYRDILAQKEPQTIEEAASLALAGGKLLWNDHVDGTKVSKGAKSMMGWGEGERQRFFAMFASKENGGVSVEQMGEAVMDICSQYNIPVDETDAMAGTNAVLEVLQSAQRPSDITGYIEHNRIEQVRRMIEEEQELLAGERNRAYMDMYGMTYDDFVEIASAIDTEDEQERNDDKNVIAWLYGQSQRQQERITNAKAELKQMEKFGVPKAKYDAAYRALEQMKAKAKQIQAKLDELTKELSAAKGQATRQKKANMRYKEKKGQWKQVYKELRKAINGKNIRSIDKNTLNEIMRAVGNADLSGMARLFGEAGMIEDIILGVNMRATQDRIDKLLATKTTALNDKGIATGKSVDASVQAILANIRKTLEGILHHDIENQIHDLRSQNWHIRHNAVGNLSQEQQEQVDANKAKIEELNAELGKELATSTATTEQAVNEQIENLTEQIDKGLRTEEESAELMTTLALKRQMVAIHTSYQDTATVEALLRRKQSELRTNWVALHDGNTPQDKREEYRQKRKALQEQIAGLEAQVREGRQATLDAMQSFADSLEETITTGRTNLKGKVQEQLQRRKDFVAKAIHDVNASGKQMQSVNEADKQENDKLPWYKRMFSPALRTFDYMLQKVATRTYGKDSWLYRQFMLGENGVMAAHDEYLRGMQTAARTLEDKAKEIFGKSYQDVMADSNRKKDIGIEILRDAEDYEPSYIPLKLTKGQATYIYMLWRMRDGYSKLATQGFTEEIMQRIEEYIGPDYIQWADWMQMEYLPMMREKYNARYREIYDTNMAAIDNYVPIRIHGQAIRKEVDLTDATASMPGMQKKNGALIQRTVNVNPIDISNNIFELIGQHIDEMEEFYAYAPVRRDLQYILSSPAFRNILNANEPGTFQSLLEAARIATKTNQQPESAALKAFNDIMNKMQKGLVSGNIAYRNMTAIKQVLSAPAFIGYSQSPEYLGILAKNMLGGYLRNLPTMAFSLILGIGHWAQKMTVEETAKGMPYIDKFLGESFRWCMREFPDFRERVTRGSAGDIRLEEKGFSELLDKYTEIGMSANVFIDAVTVSVGLKSIYDYEMKKAEKRIQKMAKEMQMDKQWKEEEMRKASNAAKIQATLFANQTQQSSNPALLSPMQVSKNFMERSLTLYKNSSLGLMRAGIGGMRNLLRFVKGKKARRRMTEEYTRMFMQEGFAENEAKKRAISYINSEARKGAFVALLEGYVMNVIWNLGSKGLLGFMTGGGDDDDKERTIGEWVWDGIKHVVKNTFGSAMPFVDDALEGRLPAIGLTTSEAEKAWKDIKKQLDENGISLALVLTGMRYAAKFGGVDTQVWANTMDGYYRLFSETGNSDDNILALMLILNSPHSNRMAVARELYKGKSEEEFQRAIELAGRYNQPVWTFGREMTDKVESDIAKWYLSDNATDEEKQRMRYIKEMEDRIDNLETVEDALEMFDEVSDTELRKKISSKINQISKPEDTFAEKVNKKKENALAEDDADMEGYTYMKMADSQDLLEEKRMRVEIDMLRPIVEQQKELFEEYGSKSDVYTRFMAEHGAEIRRYKTLKAYSRAIQTRKRRMDEEGADVQALYEEIKGLYNDAKNM